MNASGKSPLKEDSSGESHYREIVALDADVLSQPAKKKGHAAVIAWLEENQDDCYTSRHQARRVLFNCAW
jgi:hypothetical protein